MPSKVDRELKHKDAARDIVDALAGLEEALDGANAQPAKVDAALETIAALKQGMNALLSISHGGINFESTQERELWAMMAAGVAASLEPLDWEENQKTPGGEDYGLALLQWHVTRITLVADLLFHELRDRDAQRKAKA